MTLGEAIKTLELAKAEVEWDYPMDYAVAIDEAIKAIEKQIPRDSFKNECDCIVDYELLYKAIDKKCRSKNCYCHYTQSLIYLSAQDIRYSLTSMTITIRITCFCHFIICFFTFKKLPEVLINYIFISSNQSQCTCFNTFWPFGCISHNKNRSTIRRNFFLNSTRIR